MQRLDEIKKMHEFASESHALKEAWGRMVRQWCLCIKPFMEQVLVVEEAKPSMMESVSIQVLPQLKRITFGRIVPVEDNKWMFRRDKDTTFLAFNPNSKIDNSVGHFFDRFEGLAMDLADKAAWRMFHAEIGSILGYPKIAREAYGDGQILPSFYDVVTYAPWVGYPFVSFSPAIHGVQEAMDLSRKNEQILEELEMGEIVLQYARWLGDAHRAWQDKDGAGSFEDLVSVSQRLLEGSRRICTFGRGR